MSWLCCAAALSPATPLIPKIPDGIGAAVGVPALLDPPHNFESQTFPPAFVNNYFEKGSHVFLQSTFL